MNGIDPHRLVLALTAIGASGSAMNSGRSAMAA
jgi:hypothetical protein